VAIFGSVPSDSTASGSVSITAGADVQSGSIQVQTRGTDQSLEQVITGEDSSQTAFSHGYVITSGKNAKKKIGSLELAASSQSAIFPLPLLTAIVTISDTAYKYIQIEPISGISCHHIRTWNTFASQPDFQYLSSFTVRDIWISTSTYLPVKIAYSLRAGTGATPTSSVEVFYSNYKTLGGIQYPFQISESLNGTPWIDISISTVSFNTGLTDSTFSLQ